RSVQFLYLNPASAQRLRSLGRSLPSQASLHTNGRPHPRIGSPAQRPKLSDSQHSIRVEARVPGLPTRALCRGEVQPCATDLAPAFGDHVGCGKYLIGLPTPARAEQTSYWERNSTPSAAAIARATSLGSVSGPRSISSTPRS